MFQQYLSKFSLNGKCINNKKYLVTISDYEVGYFKLSLSRQQSKSKPFRCAKELVKFSIFKFG